MRGHLVSRRTKGEGLLKKASSSIEWKKVAGPLKKGSSKKNNGKERGGRVRRKKKRGTSGLSFDRP